jgi:hypothetical protein
MGVFNVPGVSCGGDLEGGTFIGGNLHAWFL